MPTDIAVEILHNRHGVTGPAVVHETWGRSLVVEVDGLLLKANGDRSTVAEALVVQRVREAGVPAPEIIDAGSDPRLPGESWIVMKRMPGTSWDASSASQSEIDSVIKDVAHHLTILHNVTSDGWGWVGDDGRGTSSSWPDWLCQQVSNSTDQLGQRLSSTFERSAHEVITKIAPALDRGSILNGDLGLSHIFIDRSSTSVIGIIDWAAAIIGDPLFDVATFSMGGPARDPIQAVLQPRLLEAYRRQLDDPDLDERRVQLYRIINHLFNACWCIDNEIWDWLDDLCQVSHELLDKIEN